MDKINLKKEWYDLVFPQNKPCHLIHRTISFEENNPPLSVHLFIPLHHRNWIQPESDQYTKGCTPQPFQVRHILSVFSNDKENMSFCRPGLIWLQPAVWSNICLLLAAAGRWIPPLPEALPAFIGNKWEWVLGDRVVRLTGLFNSNCNCAED